VFADAGISDIRLPYPLNPSNADRVIALVDRTHLSFIVDHPAVARQWSDAMTRAGQQVDVLVKVDVGFHRCGIDPDSRDALTIIRDIASLPGLRFKGLLSHAGQTYHAHSEEELRKMAEGEAQCMRDLAERCRKNGVPVEYVVFQDEGHGFTKKKNQIEGYSAVLKFLDANLKGTAGGTK